MFPRDAIGSLYTARARFHKCKKQHVWLHALVLGPRLVDAKTPTQLGSIHTLGVDFATEPSSLRVTRALHSLPRAALRSH